MEKADPAEKAARFTGPWRPAIVADDTGHEAFSAGCEGPFGWHARPATDDLLSLSEGALDMEPRDRTVPLGPRERFVVPASVEDRPAGCRSARVPGIEPAGTPDTGDAAPATAKARR